MPEARRAKAAGIAAEIGCHTFRATGITTYLAQLDAAGTSIAITQTSVAAGEENLRVVMQRYQVGVASIVDVLTAQASLDQAKVDAVNARFDYLRAKAQLEALVGRPL